MVSWHFVSRLACSFYFSRAHKVYRLDPGREQLARDDAIAGTHRVRGGWMPGDLLHPRSIRLHCRTLQQYHHGLQALLVKLQHHSRHAIVNRPNHWKEARSCSIFCFSSYAMQRTPVLDYPLVACAPSNISAMNIEQTIDTDFAGLADDATRYTTRV